MDKYTHYEFAIYKVCRQKSYLLPRSVAGVRCTAPAVHLHTVRTSGDEHMEWPSIILIKCMFLLYPLFAFLCLFLFFVF